LTEEKKDEKKSEGFKIDLDKILPTVGNIYNRLGWLLPIAERLGGFKVPKEIKEGLEWIGQGKPLTDEQKRRLAEGLTSLEEGKLSEVGVGEPVMTYKMAEDAYLMHMEGHSTRDIAEEFKKLGVLVSHATVARWVNAVADQKHFSRIARLINIGKFTAMTVVPVIIALLLGKYLL